MDSINVYTINSIKILVSNLADIFDKVRLIDPIESKVVTFDETNSVVCDEYFCHDILIRNSRCSSNCISLKSYYDNLRKTKYEFINDDIYYIVSKPVLIQIAQDKTRKFILEIISNISDEIFYDAFGANDFIKKIIESNKKIYEDSLTKVYNRRFFDEMAFCNCQNHHIMNNVAFIVMDLHDFKKINDNYGHLTGDCVLKQVGEVFKKQH